MPRHTSVAAMASTSAPRSARARARWGSQGALLPALATALGGEEVGVGDGRAGRVGRRSLRRAVVLTRPRGRLGELDLARTARKKADHEMAGLHYRRAIRWSLPWSANPLEAISALESIATQLEEDDDPYGALLAWRSLSGGVAATRFLYSAPNPARANASDQIARLVGRADRSLRLAERDPEKPQPLEHLARAQVDQIHSFGVQAAGHLAHQFQAIADRAYRSRQIVANPRAQQLNDPYI